MPPETEAASPDALALASVLCARICHDLAGTLGALTGLLDMLAEQPSQEGETLDVARGCARELGDRLRLLRAAWGADQDVDALAALLPGLPGAARIAVDLTALRPHPGEAATAQLCASLLLVAAGSLPRGGTITLAGAAGALRLTIEGQRAGWPAGLAAPAAALGGPREVATTMALLQAARLGLTLRITGPCTLELG